MKQTAVEWLEEKAMNGFITPEDFEQAKAMEKEQIEEALLTGLVHWNNDRPISVIKAEFELNLDRNGRPCIKFRHYDKHSSLEQKALKVFIDAAKEKGMQLQNTSGYIDTEGNSWENYEVQIGK